MQPHGARGAERAGARRRPADREKRVAALLDRRGRSLDGGDDASAQLAQGQRARPRCNAEMRWEWVEVATPGAIARLLAKHGLAARPPPHEMPPPPGQLKLGFDA